MACLPDRPVGQSRGSGTLNRLVRIWDSPRPFRRKQSANTNAECLFAAELPFPLLRLARNDFTVDWVNPAAESFFGQNAPAISVILRQNLSPERLQQFAGLRKAGATVHDLPVSLTLGGRSLQLLLSLAYVPGSSATWLAIRDVTAATEFQQWQLAAIENWNAVQSKLPYPGWLVDEHNELLTVNVEHGTLLPVCMRGAGNTPCSTALREQSGCGVTDLDAEKHWRTLAVAVRRTGTVSELSLSMGLCGSWRTVGYPIPGPADKKFVGLFAVPDIPVNALTFAERYPQLQALAKDMQTVREEERISVAREIHDNLGQSMTLLRLEIGRLLQMKLDGNSRELAVHRRLTGLSDRISQIMDATRNLAYDLRQDVMQDGLAKGAADYVLLFRRRAKLVGHLEVLGGWTDPSDELGRHLFRSLQEMLNNIAKHADAKRFQVRLGAIDDTLWLEVTDDGIGLPSHIMGGHGADAGPGLRSLQERAVLYGGVVVVKSRPEVAGTSIRITVKNSHA